MGGLYSLYSRQNRYSGQNVGIANQANWLTTQNYAYSQNIGTDSLVYLGTDWFINWLRADHSSGATGGKGSSKAKESQKNDKVQEDIKAKEQERNAVFKENGVNSRSELDDKVTEQGKSVETAKGDVTTAEQNVADINNQIKELNAQNPKPDNYNQKLQELNGKLEKANGELENKKNALKTEQDKLSQLQKAQEKVGEIQNKIDELEKQAESEKTPEEKKDVGEETNNMSKYTAACDAFEKSQTQENLNKVIDEYLALKDSGVNTNSLEKKLKLLKGKYKDENLDWSKANL